MGVYLTANYTCFCWHGDWRDHCHPWLLASPNHTETTNADTLAVSTTLAAAAVNNVCSERVQNKSQKIYFSPGK